MNDTYDVAVIGGGLLGCATAYYLARAGAGVLLLEKDQIGRHASGQNAGSLHFQLEYRMIEQGRKAAREAARALPLHLDAITAWRDLPQEIGEDCGVVQNGGLMLAETPHQIGLLTEKAELERSLGLDVTLLEGPALREHAPYLSTKVTAAAYMPHEGKANPRLVTPALARAAAARGAEIRVRSPLTELIRGAGRWRLGCADGFRARAQTVVIAAGVWTDQVAGMADVRLPVTPVALQMLATARTAPFLPHLVQHVGRRLSLKQTSEGNVLIGGGWPSAFVIREGRTDVDSPPGLRHSSIIGNLDAASVIPGIRPLPVLRAWSGTTTLTPDQLPLIGEVPRRPGLYAATGGSAFTLGPTYARLLSETILTGTASLPLGPYSPARFGFLNAA
ncbi:MULTISPECIES: NAD(P)/FAD-dependent oxidoreductase [unclassified Streptomyces]|uniref:NAD(P)/FAD-dependent oxidoreductase n=1 Tax=unclassified Streptomyces TaxID=2593676 RepID=UPI002237844C|nr:FAD-binding oxidoreductase [Streptomyces sp. SHP 1-2]MCW5254495.1 FAD-binding oxidoreductase [Streptomyces sp. SHP 1-2]